MTNVNSVFFKHTCSVFLLVCVWLMSGCGKSEEADLNLTTTEKMRLNLSPEVGRYLVSSEQAFQMGNYNLALAFTDSAEFAAPELADVYFMRGRILEKMEQRELASMAYQRVLALDPEYKGAYYNMGLAAFRSGMLREAIEFFSKERAIEETPFVNLELGKVYAQLGEPDSARAAYEAAIEGDPTNASAYMWLGQLYEEIGDLDKAIEYSQQGLEIKPDDPDYNYIIGSQYLRQGENEKAVEYLEPVASDLPWHQGAQYNLGQALMQLGEESRARKYLAQADTAQQMQQALNEAGSAITTDPNNRDNWVNRSTLLWQTGQRQEAIQAYMVALSIDPGNFGMQSNLASMLIESGRVEEGIRRLQTLLRINPDFVGAWINLGAALANEKQYEAARTAWENALQREPNNAQVKSFLRQLDTLEEENAE